MGHSPNSFKGDVVVRIEYPDHGLHTEQVALKIVKHDDGTVVGLTRDEWRKMLPPMLVKRADQWYLYGQPVNLKPAGGKGARDNGSI